MDDLKRMRQLAKTFGFAAVYAESRAMATIAKPPRGTARQRRLTRTRRIQKARAWWARRNPQGYEYRPSSAVQAMEWIDSGFELQGPTAIIVNETGKYPELVRHLWEPLNEPDRTESNAGSPAQTTL